MIQFSKLRLSGFKSFVDKTELEISSGLTGIVGPNGCGKSNLVEALRWVMGEASSKKMRGTGSMEDVIFNGTSSRPQRNFAEVSLLLDNTERRAPASFNGSDEIEVTRRIERDKGSNYKINGKTHRARDVQMLFADTVTGANSPALVSQGRVTAMINAKPQERRLILEESAGISGLYARRHEAELRLRAADQNLQRVQDLMSSMEGRYNALKKQVRQAVKYKDLSAQIRQLEVTIAYLEWRLLKDRIAKAHKVFSEAESIVAERMGTVTQLAKTQNTQAEDLPDLRKAEAEAAAALQAAKMELQRLEDQERALDEQIQTAQSQLEQTGSDREHERSSLEENTATSMRLDKEQAAIEENQGQEEDVLKEKQDAKDRAEQKVAKLEQDYEAIMASAAETRASRQAIETQIASEESRLLVAQERKEKFSADLAEARAEFGKDDVQDTLKEDIRTLEEAITVLREDMEAAESAYEQARDDVENARNRRSNIQTEKAKIESEISSLKAFLEAENEGDYTRLLDEVNPDKGFETALSKALGDTLMASTDDKAPVTWLERSFDNLPSLPSGASVLEPHVKAPAALKAALSMIGVVDSADDGHKLARELKPGQSLVSMDGAYWRWDGLHSKAEATDSHAVRLKQKNKLADLEAKFPKIEKEADVTENDFLKAREQETLLDEKIAQLKKDLREKEGSLSSKHSALSRATEERSGLFAQIAKLEEGLHQAEQDAQSLDVSLEVTREKLAAYDDASMDEQNQQVDQVRGALTDARNAHRDALRELDNALHEQGRRKARLHAIADERITLQNRVIRSRERLKELDDREESLKGKLEELKSTPKAIGNDRQAFMDKIQELEGKRSVAADELAKVENELADTTRALKEAEAILTEAREQRASAQATVSAGEEQLKDIEAGIAEKFDMGAEELGTHVQSFDIQAEELPEIDTFKGQKDKCVRERDMIGPVNLRAETEAAELEEQLGGIFKERDDLEQAIAELREGINQLNDEARERLNRAFDTVNGHFQRLFVQLFNGGKAHLALIESDDPLESGLEIFAQPPGKTLQSLTLLSGGEQTLASIALIFAMFLTNPSPICVLDEIDAPLDDANVDRVCDLLDEIAEQGTTRFLIITHHRLTMARMDRLYGVTMAERGVSQLVSVDLNQQMDFLEAAE